MLCATDIAAALLETDPDEFEPQRYLDRLADNKTGEVNAVTARSAYRFYHRTLNYTKSKYTKSNTPIEVRRNGATKYWKREPLKFRIPVKYGLRDCFYIDNTNASDWSTQPL